jgi:RelA/SpoT family (p)ppGpp synthetase
MMGTQLLTSPEKLFEQFNNLLPQESLELVRQAYDFAEAHYANIDHPVGEAYLQYASEIALRLSELCFDPMLVVAAFLYPPPFMKEQILREIKRHFPQQFSLVEDIARLECLEWSPWLASLSGKLTGTEKERSEVLHNMFLLAIGDDQEEVPTPDLLAAVQFQKKEKQVENIVRMFLTSVDDIQALIFKLVDRLHFIKLLKDPLPRRQEGIHIPTQAWITLAIYAPLADRLGIWRIKSELEDMSFRLIEPETYKKIGKQLEATKEERKKHVGEIIGILQEKLADFGLEAEVSGRAKHIYSIYQKMEAKQLTIDELNDLQGIRIIVASKEECYLAQSIIHEGWEPIMEMYEGQAGRDWIARPKENLYQSLHTTIRLNDKIVEVQIRTGEMHEIAEYGVAAAHWRYKESKAYRRGKMPKVTKSREQLWSEHFASIRKSLSGKQEEDIFAQLEPPKMPVFVITPKGNVLDFPAGATALDFAYRIHTELGNRYTGAKVGNRLVRLNYRLQTGDIVELITSRAGKGPNPEWLATSRDERGKSTYLFAQTAQARGKIRHELKQVEAQKPKPQK